MNAPFAIIHIQPQNPYGQDTPDISSLFSSANIQRVKFVQFGL